MQVHLPHTSLWYHKDVREGGGVGERYEVKNHAWFLMVLNFTQGPN
jgi:hypothetical protein